MVTLVAYDGLFLRVRQWVVYLPSIPGQPVVPSEVEARRVGASVCVPIQEQEREGAWLSVLAGWAWLSV